MVSFTPFSTRRVGVLLPALGGLLAACGQSTFRAPAPPTGAAGDGTRAVPSLVPDLITSAASLRQSIDQAVAGTLRIIDARPLADYDKGHIPGAVSLPVAETFDPARDRNYPDDPQRLAALLGGRGIGSSERVVVYDNGKETPAARLLWTLEYLGQRAVSLLDGGLGAWQAAGGALTTEPPAVRPATFAASVRPETLHSKAQCERMLSAPAGVIMLDSRSPEEYRGDDVRAKYGGRIPGAVNVDWREQVSPEGVLKPVDALRALYASKGITPDHEIVAYCQTGQRSAVTYWVLRLLGYAMVTNYAGSWVEWGNDPTTPKQTG